MFSSITMKIWDVHVRISKQRGFFFFFCLGHQGATTVKKVSQFSTSHGYSQHCKFKYTLPLQCLCQLRVRRLIETIPIDSILLIICAFIKSVTNVQHVQHKFRLKLFYVAEKSCKSKHMLAGYLIARSLIFCIVLLFVKLNIML